MNGADKHPFGMYSRHVPRIVRHQLIAQLMEQYIQTDEASESVHQKNKEHKEPVIDVVRNCCRPSIQRFHCSLLFVDISGKQYSILHQVSLATTWCINQLCAMDQVLAYQIDCVPFILILIIGFTALSLRLSVDELKNHINDYFTTMLDIVEKHGGEVVKFAGDAIYIIWRTKVPSTVDTGHTPSYIFEQLRIHKLEGSGGSSNLPEEVRRAYEHAVYESTEKAFNCGIEISEKCNNHKINFYKKSNTGNISRI